MLNYFISLAKFLTLSGKSSVLYLSKNNLAIFKSFSSPLLSDSDDL